MTPLEYYHQQINAGLIQKDEQQLAVMQELQNIYFKLMKKNQAGKPPLGWLLHPLIRIQKIQGLYVWGNVGVGKTFMIDLFYSCLPQKKIRSHFHQFMQDIHQQLKKYQGIENPLNQIAKKIAQKTEVLCFDEFMVDDIADAMILSNLFKALFAQKICLIASANSPPDDLYKNGLQRELFLPAIALIKQHTQIFHIISRHDYRLTPTPQDRVYFTPLNEAAELNMQQCFQYYAGDHPISFTALELLGHQIKIRQQAGSTIWFEFLDLCGIPRSQNDYLELTKKYKTVLISNVPIITADQHNLISAFIHLIDIFYDARIRVIISAAADIENLYPEGRLRFAFARTQSRLIEMQSKDYTSH